MADYAAAYKEGVVAAEVGEAARGEINAVFKELDEQLRAATEGKLGIARKRVKSDDFFEVPALEAFRYAMGYRKPTHMAVVAEVQPEGGDPTIIELAEWSEHEFGYPCTLTVAGQQTACADREALERTLENVLRDARTGDKLRRSLSQ